MTESTKGTEHKCPFCDREDNCKDDCGLGYSISCNDCYDKGLIE